MIYQLREKLAIPALIRLIAKYQDKFPLPLETIVRYLVEAVEDEDSVVLIDEEDKEVKGVLYATIEFWDGERVCFIHLCVILPSQRHTGEGFMSRIIHWAREKGAKKLVISTERPKEFERKYKFKLSSYILEKPIKEKRNKEEKDVALLQGEKGKS